MTKWRALPKPMRTVLKEQCRRVHVRPKDIDWDSPEWYRSRAWSELEEARFVTWLTDRLYHDDVLRQGLLEHPRKDRTHCARAASEWDFQYGWGRHLLPAQKPEILKEVS